MNNRSPHPISEYVPESYPYEFSPTKQENTNAYRALVMGRFATYAPGEEFTHPTTLERISPPTPVEPPRRLLRPTFTPNIERPTLSER